MTKNAKAVLESKICVKCGTLDWQYDEVDNLYHCEGCKANTMSTRSLQEWSEVVFKSFDDAQAELGALTSGPQPEGMKSLIHKAKIKRAEKALDEASRQCQVVSAIQLIESVYPKGEVSIEIPEEFNIKIRFGE